MGIPLEPFKDREHIVAEIKLCARMATVFSGLAMLFVVVGVIADLIDETLGLETISWFLLAIMFSVASVIPQMHVVTAKHLLGIEVIKK